jgi:cytoskeletal protein RodZ
MKKGNTLMIVFFVLLTVFGFLVVLAIKQSSNGLRQKNFFQNNQQSSQSVNQTNVNQPEIPTAKPVEQGLTLEITEPKENATYNSPAIKISGKTKANAEVYINDTQTKADSFGNFSVDYNLDEGENLLTIVANDSAGNYAEKEITVFLQTQE